MLAQVDDEQQYDSDPSQDDAIAAIHAAAQSWPRAQITQTQADQILSDKQTSAASASSVASTTSAKTKPGSKDDLLIVMPSNVDRMPIVAASRGWRQGVKTYVTFEQEIDLANSSRLFQVPRTGMATSKSCIGQGSASVIPT